MITITTLSLFILAVLTLLLSPGPNMAFVMSHGISHGKRGGLAASLGIAVGDLILTVLTATGVTALVAAWPPSFDILRISGALYLLWLAFNALRAPSDHQAQSQQTSFARIVRMAMLNTLMNPKALLFFMVFLPQFVVIEHGQVTWQLIQFGIVLSVVAFIFHAILGLFSGQMRRVFHNRPHAARFQRYFLSSVLVALAVRLFLSDKPTTH